jgi:AraC-like DNA-binding protein
MRGAIVLPDAVHSFTGMNSLLAMLFVDPESIEGRWLRQSLREPVTTIPDARMDRVVPPLLQFEEAPLEAMETAELIKLVTSSLCAGAPPSRPLDPRVVRALEFMREAETPKLRLEDVADTVFLSPSRFAHLFSENVGLPFRRYLLWRKLSRAMLAIGRGVSLGQAAYEAGFADAAHLTRTFIQMWGTPPSVLMKGEFFEVPAPFEVGAGRLKA